MSNHVVFGRPMVVTEEKLNEAMKKQMKQRELREALDKQIAQARKLKDEALAGMRNVNKVTYATRDQPNGYGYGNDPHAVARHNKMNNDITDSTTTPRRNAQEDLRGNGVATLLPLCPSTSLPPNFAMSTSEGNPLAPPNVYNTNSTSANVVTRLARGGNVASTALASPRGKEPLPLGGSPQRNHPVANSPGTVCSNSPPRGGVADDAKTKVQVQKQHSPRKSVKSKVSSGLVAGKAPVSGGRRQFSQSPKRPGGLLPPLEVVDGISSRHPSEGTVLSGRNIETN
ncbi:unnamed protein product, partial [Trypanosoma congolense IL3000]